MGNPACNTMGKPACYTVDERVAQHNGQHAGQSNVQHNGQHTGQSNVQHNGQRNGRAQAQQAQDYRDSQSSQSDAEPRKVAHILTESMRMHASVRDSQVLPRGNGAEKTVSRDRMCQQKQGKLLASFSLVAPSVGWNHDAVKEERGQDQN